MHGRKGAGTSRYDLFAFMRYPYGYGTRLTMYGAAGTRTAVLTVVRASAKYPVSTVVPGSSRVVSNVPWQSYARSRRLL